MDKNRIIISFSSRINGNCHQVGNCILSFDDKISSIYKFSDFDIHPCGNCTYPCFEEAERCPHLADMEYTLLEQICRSELAYFIVPNYCDYPCANFFIFNERSQCYFQNHPERLERYLNVPKLFLVISGSTSSHFAEAFEQHTNGTPEILFLNPKQFGKSSIGGNLMESDDARHQIADFIRNQTESSAVSGSAAVETSL